MQINSKKFVLAACLAVTVATTGLVGCHTEDRSAGRYMDDKLIAHRVESNLSRDPVYKYPDVHVNVFDGVAQLSGFVDTQVQIKAAAEHASRADGVRQVINDITLKPQFKLVPTGAPTGNRYDRYDRNDTNTWNGDNGVNRAPIVNGNHNPPSTAPVVNGNTGGQ